MSTAGSAPTAAAGARKLAELFSLRWGDTGPVHLVERNHRREHFASIMPVTSGGRG
jgi:hypothetical protein